MGRDHFLQLYVHKHKVCKYVRARMVATCCYLLSSIHNFFLGSTAVASHAHLAAPL